MSSISAKENLKKHGFNEIRELLKVSAFKILIISNLLIVFSMRLNTQTIIESFSKSNKVLYIVSRFVVVLLLLVLGVPFLRDLFSFSTLGLIDLVYCFIAGLMAVIIFEGIKVYKRIFLPTNNPN